MDAIGLCCNHAVDPLGVDSPCPRLRWRWQAEARGSQQTAYQVLVASDPSLLEPDLADAWNSGRVDDATGTGATYQGAPLVSRTAYFWQIRGWDQNDVASSFGAPARFEMGLLAPDEWTGSWISGSENVSSPLLRRDLQLGDAVRRARVYVSGLGYYELRINGAKVGRHVLDPATTYYHNDQPFPLGARVLYATYDVTNNLREGSNTIGVILGHGWYSAEPDVAPSPSHREPYGSRPCLMLQAHIELQNDRQVVVQSDGTWRSSVGPITYNDYSHGESYDARREQPGWDCPEFDDSAWTSVHRVKGPGGRLVAQSLPPIEVTDTLTPERVLNPQPGVHVFDFGQHFSGWSRLRVNGERGTEVRLAHGARVHEDGSLDARSNLYDLHCTHIARQRDTYTLSGAGDETWEPRFTLHGSRFVEVTGYPSAPALDAIDGRVVRTGCRATGSFTCSNDLLNRIHAATWWTFASSLQGFPQDAADRSERVGWLGDPIPEDFLYNFDCATFWTKWAHDLADSQKENGHVPTISPVHWRRTHDAYATMPVWSSTYAVIVWALYRFLGDEQILEHHYPGLRRLVGYLGDLAEGHVIEKGLGDHMEPQPDGSTSSHPRHTPPALTSTAYYYWDVHTLSRIAAILGREEESQRYGALAEEIAATMNSRFLDPATCQYATGSQTANALPLHLGLVPEWAKERVLQNLIHNINDLHVGHLATGMLGTNALANVLPRHGAADVMYRIATRTTFPSWGYMLERGATTLWESWTDDRDEKLSLNMKLMGSVDKFFYQDVAGIRPLAPGFRHIAIEPQVVGDLTSAAATIDTVRGPAEVAWVADERNLDVTTRIPANATARVSLPKRGYDNVEVTEGGRPVWRKGSFVPGTPGVRQAEEDETGDRVILEIGSGSYNLKLSGIDAELSDSHPPRCGVDRT